MSRKNCVEELTAEIRSALNHELYVIAVMASLTLPDMCAALEKEKFWATNGSYVDWCKQNLPAEFFSLATPELMKEMRNNLLHTGRLDDAKEKGTGRLVLTLPNRSIHFMNCRVNNNFLTDVNDFCEGLCVAAKRWLEKNRDNETVQKNFELMVQRREDGLSPFVSGIDVIG